MRLNLLSAIPGRSWAVSLRAAGTLWWEYGHVRSSREGSAVDKCGSAIPWYTYPAIEYLKQLDFRDKDVFEFGSGQSTIFWSDRARRVVAVEDEEEWFRVVSSKVPSNCHVVLETDLSQYPDHLRRYPDGFDVIVVDGPARSGTRLKCSRVALEHLRPGGMIILDNSDWLPASAQLLRKSGLIEVDMTGLVPLVGHTQTTSFFLHRQFAFEPAGRQPMPGPGAPRKNWERSAPAEPPMIEFEGVTFSAIERDVPFEKLVEGERRRFRLVTCRRVGDYPATAAILDVDAERVLLTISEPTSRGIHTARSVADELAAVLSMRDEEFQQFVNAHPKRSYVLRPLARDRARV